MKIFHIDKDPLGNGYTVYERTRSNDGLAAMGGLLLGVVAVLLPFVHAGHFAVGPSVGIALSFAFLVLLRRKVHSMMLGLWGSIPICLGWYKLTMSCFLLVKESSLLAYVGSAILGIALMYIIGSCVGEEECGLLFFPLYAFLWFNANPAFNHVHGYYSIAGVSAIIFIATIIMSVRGQLILKRTDNEKSLM